ncbi:MAG: polyprenyl synthetase family protein [Taibaiella sp.]|nr:polyprenyl synthetase family protein [Taibaiella sp.]
MYSFATLSAQFEERFISALPFPAAPVTLYDPCRYLLALGGKRIRPALCLMANELFMEISDDAWYAAEAIEIFHNFTLVHDDIMDKAPTRRGQPAIHERYGLATGILSGDVMCIYAYERLAYIKNALPQVLQLFNRTAIEVCEGQQLDMDFEQRNDVTLEEYIHMITLKTSVLLACSLKIGALVSGGSGDNAHKLYSFGRDMGIAFQLQDDFLDAFGQPGLTGKQSGGDILANKKTYLLVSALKYANDAQRRAITQLLSTDAPTKVADILALYRATGADERCRQATADYTRHAFDCLEEVAIPSKRKQPLLELATMLLGRNK